MDSSAASYSSCLSYDVFKTFKNALFDLDWLIDWLVCCLLAGPDLWNRMPLKCSITMVFTCPLLSWCKMSSHFRENNNVVVFPIPFHIFMPLANLWLIRLQRQFSILRTRSCPDPYPLIRPPKRPLALVRGRILTYPGIHSVPSYVSRLWRCPHSPARRCR
jgi:hypothetical protein